VEFRRLGVQSQGGLQWGVRCGREESVDGKEGGPGGERQRIVRTVEARSAIRKGELLLPNGGGARKKARKDKRKK